MNYLLEDKIDFARHNAAVRELMAACANQTHERAPVIVGGSIRNLLSNPELNHTGYSFKDFFTKAEAQVECQLEYQRYVRHNIVCDREMGPPEKEWQLTLDFQNSHDQAWFGCPMLYFGDGDVPDTEELLKDNPSQLHDWEDPDPFFGRGDFMRKAMDIYERMRELCDKGYEFHGKPVRPPHAFQAQGGDGVFTLALKIRGTVECMCDMYENPEYFHQLMDYLTRNTIRRMMRHREWAGTPQRGAFFYADDSIAMLSQEQFKEFVLPYWKRIFAEFHDPREPSSIHLCGDATHHFKFLADTFNVKTFDTGFPVDHGKLRKELGPDVHINGGPTIMLVKDGTPEQIEREVARVCSSGVLEGKRFTLIAANNLAPCTPVRNIQALYEAGKKHGRFQR